MNNRHRWAVIAGALLLAAVVGAIAWNAGVAHGIEASGKVVDGRYGWHPHGGFFFWPLFPLFFLFFFFFVARGFFWHRRGYCGDGLLDEWHRRAHERMWNGEQQHEDDPGRR